MPPCHALLRLSCAHSLREALAHAAPAATRYRAHPPMQTKLRESFAKKQKELEEMRQKAEERRSAAKNELDQV